MDSRPRATISDVARVAGVAPMTVSRVLTGSANVRLGTAERVRKAVEMLRYQPNEMARALRGQRSRSIGLIVPKLSDPFFATCSHAIDDVAKRHGYSVLFTTSNDSRDIEFSQAQMMVQRGVEGIVVIPAAGSRSLLERTDFQGLHIVALDRPLDEPSFDSVLVQNRDGARRAVEHLISHGHREIFFLSEANNTIFTEQERLAGYREAVERAGLRANVYQKCDSLEAASGFLRSSIGKGRDEALAVFAGNGPVAGTLLRAAAALGLNAPDDIALIGFDDFPFADLLQPGITVVRQPIEQLGRLAADLLFEQIEREDSRREGTTVMLPVELILRHSCGCTARRPAVTLVQKPAAVAVTR